MINRGVFKFRIERRDYDNDYALGLWWRRDDDSIDVVETPTIRHYSLEELENLTFHPGFSFQREELQIIFDELCRVGFRPSDQVPQEVPAIKNHLQDMRTIAFHCLGMGISGVGTVKKVPE